MTVLKWVLVVFGVLFLAAGAGVVGVIYWASGIESVEVTEADLAVGGRYPPEERQAMLDACQRGAGKDRAESCACIADRAGTELSRFLRLVLTATFEGSATKIVAITKGLMNSGVPQERAAAMEKEAEPRFDALMQACGLK